MVLKSVAPDRRLLLKNNKNYICDFILTVSAFSYLFKGKEDALTDGNWAEIN